MASKHKSMVSVCQAEGQHPTFMFKVGKSGDLVTWASDEFEAMRRQDLDPAYFLDGSVYISFVDTFIERRTFCHDDTAVYVVPKWKSLEIDDFVDFVCVEAIMSARDSILSLADK